jgi:hypothetical protein
MKDFTKTQEKSNVQEKVGAMKCNTCNYEVRSFGVQPGRPCANPDAAECTGRMMKTDEAAMDRAKRKADGAA